MSDIVSANEAAHRFGLSEKTVRRWITSGKLKADKSGRAYRVMLSEVAALITPDTAHDRGHTADTAQTADIHSAPSTADSMSAMSGIPELVALVDRLQSEARQHAETAAMWQERAGSLADRLALAESQLLALAAPESPQEAPTATIADEPAADAPTAFGGFSLPGWVLPTIAIVIVVIGVLLTMPR
jgi:excisionase family DNA binding protein